MPEREYRVAEAKTSSWVTTSVHIVAGDIKSIISGKKTFLFLKIEVAARLGSPSIGRWKMRLDLCYRRRF